MSRRAVVGIQVFATTLVLVVCYEVHDLLRRLAVPYEAAAAVKQVRDSNEGAAAVAALLHSDASLWVVVGVAVAALFVIWSWPLWRQNGSPT